MHSQPTTKTSAGITSGNSGRCWAVRFDSCGSPWSLFVTSGLRSIQVLSKGIKRRDGSRMGCFSFGEDECVRMRLFDVSLGTIEEERTAERKGSMWEYLIV